MTDRDQPRHRPLAIWGAYGGMNIGDEAILVALVSLLRRRDLDPRSLIVQNEPDKEANRVYRRLGLQPISFRHPLRLFSALRHSDLVCGGGQLIDDRGGLGFPVGYTAVLTLINRMFGGRPIIFGIGAEPVLRRTTKWLVRTMYGRAHMAMVRDTPSERALTEAGFPAEKTAVGGDIALTLDDIESGTSSNDGQRLLLIPNRDTQRVGDLAATFDVIAATARQEGWQVTVMAHDRRNDYDAGELARMAEVLGTDDIEYVVPATLDAGLAHYRNADVVVSARMHPLLLSILHGVTPVAIPVVDKVRTLVADLSILSLQPSSGASNITAALAAARDGSLDHIEPILDARCTAIEKQLDLAAKMWTAEECRTPDLSEAK
ncbi:MAG: polysaccharide pyruvyl transferase family protein [bacterium]|nr:polysaccharide pyruvyl transferase family protein [bacterium]MCP4965270.1 polysaccharide pyruvyl transferase family protein [bacterium]